MANKSSKKATQSELKLVCLDAGHGGVQVGAVNSEFGFLEKDIALDITRLVREYLMYATKDEHGEFVLNNFCPDNQKSVASVFMTRTEDVDISLSSRCAFANAKCTDCFISIHCNSHETDTPNGIETWMYSNGSDKSLKLAKSIQECLMTSVSGVKVTDKDGKTHDIKSRGVKKSSAYYTLRHTSMPSIVVECGFMSHRGEVQLLNSIDYQDKLARGIALGILKGL